MESRVYASASHLYILLSVLAWATAAKFAAVARPVGDIDRLLHMHVSAACGSAQMLVVPRCQLT